MISFHHELTFKNYYKNLYYLREVLVLQVVVFSFSMPFKISFSIVI